jgi:serine/threonine-protein kinase
MSADARVTLQERLSQGPLPVDESVRIIWALCDRFEKLGKTETLGDVAPSRVTLVGKAVEASIPDARPVLGYSAPERTSSAPTPRSDVYAMGALLVHLVTGKAYDGSPLPQAALHLQPVLEKCLAKEPPARFANLSELKRALVRMDKTLMSGPKATAEKAFSRESLGPWQLEGLLGQGSMGHVFKARHQALGRLAAIKVLRPEQYANPELVQRFFQEARTVNQINHEHIVEISDFVQEPGANGPSIVYCVMEFLQGRTLAEELETSSLSLERGLRITEQLCDALAAAHRVGVVHRDVKPDNIMLIERGGSKDYVKVLDFGVAKLVDTSGKAVVATTEGAIIGTPICMSPEQAQGDDVDPRSDVWAVGVILYRLLTGHFPFDAPTFVNIAVQIITKPYAPLPAKSPSGEPIPPRLKRLVERCLQKQRELRPATMDAVRDELAAVVRGEAGEDDPPPRREKGPFIVVGLALALAGAFGVYTVVSQPKTVEPVVPNLPTVPIEPLSPVDAGVEAPDAGLQVEPIDAGSVDAGTEEPIEDAGVPGPVDAGVVRKVTPKAIKLTTESVSGIVKQLLPKLSGCVAKFPDQRPAVQGRVLAFEIQKSGKLTKVHLEPAGTSSALETCITTAVSKTTFPPNDGAAPMNRPRIPLKLGP